MHQVIRTVALMGMVLALAWSCFPASAQQAATGQVIGYSGKIMLSKASLRAVSPTEAARISVSVSVSGHSGLSSEHRARLAPPAPFPVHVDWLRVQPGQPRTLYIGDAFGCPENQTFGQLCPDWVLRSQDAGTTWTDMRPALHIAHWGTLLSLSPMVMASDGRHSPRIWPQPLSSRRARQQAFISSARR